VCIGRAFCAIKSDAGAINRYGAVCNLRFAMKSKFSVSNGRVLQGAIASVLVLGGATVYAQTSPQSSSMAVSANVADACTINASPMAFGTYDAVARTAKDGAGSITLTCTTGATARVKLNEGLTPFTGSAPGTPLRQMAANGGAALLRYNLFSDVARTIVWAGGAGVGAASTDGVVTTGTGIAVVMPVYGQIEAGQFAPAGAYLDTVVATVTF
jgi:spore coat protein U-like protein